MKQHTLTNQHVSGNILAALVLGLWATAVATTATTGVLNRTNGPEYAGLVVLGIVVPYLLYRFSSGVSNWVSNLGLEALTKLHVWRIPAALMFLYFGVQGKLPPVFWVAAGAGDFIAGMLAATRWSSKARLSYETIHRVGMADFVMAVGLGLTFTVLNDPRVVTLRELPMALIPLFGVGLSGASHLMAFDQLRRLRASEEK